MSMLYCKFCRAYTPSGGDRCSVCGMNYLYREDLGLKVKQVRPYLESAVEPIRIRPVKGRTIELKDARYSEPFYAKVTDPRNYESEYLIMDRPTLDSVIGEMVPLSKGIGRQSGMVGGHRVDVAFTNDADMIASLNRKPKKKSSKKGKRASKRGCRA